MPLHAYTWGGNRKIPVDVRMAVKTIFYKLILRKLKSSLKDTVILDSHTSLSSYWKDMIITSIKPIFNNNIQCGVVFDPMEFIPKYILRFLKRQEMEGNVIPPGNYEVTMKVF